MTREEARTLLNAAQAGLWVSQLKITQALMATGDLSPGRRVFQEPQEVTHALPAFEPENRPPAKEQPTVDVAKEPAKKINLPTLAEWCMTRTKRHEEWEPTV